MNTIGLFRGLRRSLSRNVIKINNNSSNNSNRVQMRYMGGGGHGNNNIHTNNTYNYFKIILI